MGILNEGRRPFHYLAVKETSEIKDHLPTGEGSMNEQTIADMEIAGKRVLIRADLNVPLEKGKVSDDTRIVAALPTIRYVLAYDAIPIVCSHLGRPKGKPDLKYTLKPVAERLAELFGSGCTWLPTVLDQCEDWWRRYHAVKFCSWKPTVPCGGRG